MLSLYWLNIYLEALLFYTHFASSTLSFLFSLFCFDWLVSQKGFFNLNLTNVCTTFCLWTHRPTHCLFSALLTQVCVCLFTQCSDRSVSCGIRICVSSTYSIAICNFQLNTHQGWNHAWLIQQKDTAITEQCISGSSHSPHLLVSCLYFLHWSCLPKQALVIIPLSVPLWNWLFESVPSINTIETD